MKLTRENYNEWKDLYWNEKYKNCDILRKYFQYHNNPKYIIVSANTIPKMDIENVYKVYIPRIGYPDGYRTSISIQSFFKARDGKKMEKYNFSFWSRSMDMDNSLWYMEKQHYYDIAGFMTDLKYFQLFDLYQIIEIDGIWNFYKKVGWNWKKKKWHI